MRQILKPPMRRRCVVDAIVIAVVHNDDTKRSEAVRFDLKGSFGGSTRERDREVHHKYGDQDPSSSNT